MNTPYLPDVARAHRAELIRRSEHRAARRTALRQLKNQHTTVKEMS